VIVCVPTPAVAGSKFPDATPTPEYKPPLGLPLVKGKAGVFMQTTLKLPKVTVGDGFTVRDELAELEQPCESE